MRLIALQIAKHVHHQLLVQCAKQIMWYYRMEVANHVQVKLTTTQVVYHVLLVQQIVSSVHLIQYVLHALVGTI